MRKDTCFLQIITIAHATALLTIVLADHPAHIPTRWYGQIFFLLLMSLAASLSFARPSDTRRWSPYAAAFIHFIICFIIGYAEGSRIGLELILLSVIASDISFRLKGISLWSLTALFSFAVTLLQQESILWWSPEPAPSVGNIVILNVIFWGCIAFFKHISNMQNELDDIRDINTKLKSIIKNYSSSGVMHHDNSNSTSQFLYEEERKMFIHEIHDTVSYSLVNIIALLEAVSGLNSKDTSNTAIPGLLAKAKEQAKISLRELRIILRGLRNRKSSANYDLNSLKGMVSRFENVTGIKIRMEMGNLPYHMEKELYHVVYLFIQEGLTNAFKHGRASVVTIYLWIMDGFLTAQMQDDGKGCDNVEKGLGFFGIEERLKKWDGTFRYRNLIKGFEISITLSYEKGQ